MDAETIFDATTVNSSKIQEMFETWVITDMHPFTMIEEERLIELIHELNPFIKLQMGDATKVHIMKRFDLEKLSIISKVNLFNLIESTTINKDLCCIYHHFNFS